MDSEKGNRVLAGGGHNVRDPPPPPHPPPHLYIGFGAPKRPGWDMVNMQIEVDADLHGQVLITSTCSDPK